MPSSYGIPIDPWNPESHEKTDGPKMLLRCIGFIRITYIYMRMYTIYIYIILLYYIYNDIEWISVR